MDHRKRCFGWLLALVLLAQVLPVGASAELLPVPQEQNGVPLYFQTDYPHIRYGDGTMATSGCGPTCLAMVATYLTGYEYTPDRIADYFSEGKDNVYRLEYGSGQLNLPWRKAVDFYDAYNALKQGDVAIAMMGPESFFTTTAHFMVMAGATEDGRILMNDPMKVNYYGGLADIGLRIGLLPDEVLMGFDGAWIYDVSAMDTPQYRHEEPYVKPRYPWTELPEEDTRLLASFLTAQAGEKSQKCQQAMAEVLLNRVVYHGFSDTLAGVIHAAGLTDAVLVQAEPTQVQYDAIRRALRGPYLLPEDVVYYGTAAPNANIFRKLDDIAFCYPAYYSQGYLRILEEEYYAAIPQKRQE